MLTIGLAVLGASGCAFDVDPPEDPAHDTNTASLSLTNTDVLNGIDPNGIDPNGIDPNGIDPNGIDPNGIDPNGIDPNGSTLVGLSVDSSSIKGGTLKGKPIKAMWMVGSAIYIKAGSKTYTGDDLIGAEATGKLEDGSSITLKLEDAQTFTSKNGKQLHKYVISFVQPSTNFAGYVCGKNQDIPIKAIPLVGRWNYERGTPDGGSKIEDYDSITFACEGFALYKCVDLGYFPWAKEKGKSLSKFHQACTRMIRADYCGDGVSWTLNGTLVNVYDNLKIQKDEANWPIEAEWNEHGARCLSHQRIQNMPEVPECSFDRSPMSCGNPPQWSKTLLVSEAQ